MNEVGTLGIVLRKMALRLYERNRSPLARETAFRSPQALSMFFEQYVECARSEEKLLRSQRPLMNVDAIHTTLGLAFTIVWLMVGQIIVAKH